MTQNELQKRQQALTKEFVATEASLKVHEQRVEEYEELSRSASQFLTETVDSFRRSSTIHQFEAVLEVHSLLDRQICDHFIEKQETLLRQKRLLEEEDGLLRRKLQALK